MSGLITWLRTKASNKGTQGCWAGGQTGGREGRLTMAQLLELKQSSTISQS